LNNLKNNYIYTRARARARAHTHTHTHTHNYFLNYWCKFWIFGRAIR